MGKSYCLGKLFGHLYGIQVTAGGRDRDRTMKILSQPVTDSPNLYLIDFPGIDEDVPLVRAWFKFAPVLLNFAIGMHSKTKKERKKERKPTTIGREREQRILVSYLHLKLVVTELKRVHTSGYEQLWKVLAEILKSGTPTLILLNRADETAEEEELKKDVVTSFIAKQRGVVVERLKDCGVPATVQFLYKSLASEATGSDYSWQELQLEDIILPSCLEMHAYAGDEDPIVRPQVKRFLQGLRVLSEVEIWHWICKYAQPWMAHLPPPSGPKDT